MLKKYYELIDSINKSIIRNATDEFNSCSILWLDNSVNTTQENIHGQNLFRSSIGHLKTFDNVDRCEEYILSAPIDERFILIVSGRLGRILTPRIHHLRQVSSIYVYCLDKAINEKWAIAYTKVKDIITSFPKLIEKIQAERSKRSENEVNEILPFSVSTQQHDFIASQLLTNVLLSQLLPIQNDKSQLVNLLKEKYYDIDVELKLLQAFEQNYSANQALDWYMRDSCIYRVLKRAVRQQNLKLLLFFRFFLQDIHQIIESKKCTSPVRVYRSQLLTKNELTEIYNSINHFISINTFFSTSICRELVLMFLNQSSNDLERVMFEIDADPNHMLSKPFCFIESNTFFRQTEEVLFTIGSVFRLTELHQDADGLWIVRLTSCADEDDKQLKELFKPYYLDEKINLIAFGNLLIKLNRLADAEKVFIQLINEYVNQPCHLADCYFALGTIAEERKMYDVSLDWHKTALDIKMKNLSENDISLAESYKHIGEIHLQKSDYKQALAAYLRALNVNLQVYGENHVHVAMCYTKLGGIYQKQENYKDALNCHKKALAIQQKNSSDDNSDVGIAYNNVAIIYACLNQYDLALECYEKALENLLKTLSPLHLEVAVSYCGLGLICEHKNEFEKALSFYEKTAVIYRQTLSSTHPDVIEIERHIRRISSKL
ncbi:unnamed protein product [Adineta ricciae]|uniref:Uncharacterized protein n=1 Tax=Adineta ricciae TaxID=249248 RepID=A0A814PM53_ADIRI|nr:unnamed protein product [Adineta ricciae]